MEEQKSVLSANKKPTNKNRDKDKKTPVGLIIAIIGLSAALVACAVILVVVLVNSRGDDGAAKSDDKGSSISGKTDKKKTNKKKTSAQNDNDGIEKASRDNGYVGDHVRGKRDSKVLVVEYADMQCPGCAAMMPKMDSIYRNYGDKVAFVYRHYPINGHQNARSAAIAVEAAGKQGYFWEMLTEMFARRNGWIMTYKQSVLTDAYIDIFKEASNDKGDVAQFKKDLNDSNLAKKVDSDKNHGTKDEITATPTVFVNGEAVDFYTATDPQQAIEDAIDDALNDVEDDDDDDGDDEWDW